MNQQRSNLVRFLRGMRAGLGLASVLLQCVTVVWVVLTGMTKEIDVSASTYGNVIYAFAAFFLIMSFVTSVTQIFMAKYWQLSFSSAVLGITLAYLITRTGQQSSLEGFDFDAVENIFGMFMIYAWIYAGTLYFAFDGLLVLLYRIIKWLKS